MLWFSKEASYIVMIQIEISIGLKETVCIYKKKCYRESTGSTSLLSCLASSTVLSASSKVVVGDGDGDDVTFYWAASRVSGVKGVTGEVAVVLVFCVW